MITQEHRKIAVAGATGRVGRYVVDALRAKGHEVVPISRSGGVDVITGDSLSGALEGVECIIDTATGPSPEQQPATEFFTAAAHNLQQAGQHAGVKRMVVVSIIGCDRFELGYNASKVAHERAHASGGVPVQILRAAQFHEFVPLLAEWGRQGDVCYIPRMRTQLVAARSVGEALADLATSSAAPAAPGASGAPTSEIAGPRPEDVIEMAGRLLARRGDQVRIEPVSDPADPDGLYQNGGLLPGPDAVLAGPTFEEWLSTAA